MFKPYAAFLLSNHCAFICALQFSRIVFRVSLFPCGIVLKSFLQTIVVLYTNVTALPVKSTKRSNKSKRVTNFLCIGFDIEILPIFERNTIFFVLTRLSVVFLSKIVFGSIAKRLSSIQFSCAC